MINLLEEAGMFMLTPCIPLVLWQRNKRQTRIQNTINIFLIHHVISQFIHTAHNGGRYHQLDIILEASLLGR